MVSRCTLNLVPYGTEQARGNLSSMNKAAAVSVLGTCFTKQTGDMVYTMAENGWLSQLWLDA